MQIETLTGLNASDIKTSIQDRRTILFSPRLKNRNPLMSLFISEPDTLLYTLSSADTELSSFLENLIHHLADYSAGTYRQTAQALADKRSTVIDKADALAADLRGLTPQPPYLILDEFDYLSPSEDVTAFFTRFATQLSQNIRLIVNGRSLDFTPWSEMVESGDAVVLGEQMALDGGIFIPGQMDKPHLEVYGLGSGKVLVDGRPIDTWDGPLPRNLFFYFVDHPLVTRDEIFEIFWPGLEKKEATNVFHVTKRKISERIGYEVTEYSGGFYRPSEALSLHYDVARLEESYRRGEAKTDRSDINDWYEVIHLYRSEFLHRVDMPWVNERREQLRREYTAALIGVGRLFKSLREMDKAIHYYTRALREQPNREDIHRDLMSIYQAEGQTDKAVAQYRQLESLLQRTLSIKPAPATVLLYNMITGQAK